MTARLILARHGNTFKAEDRPVWIGARTDLPLIEKGVAQAHALAEALLKAAILPASIIAGPLQRTQETARIAASALGIAPDAIRTDPRLREIDYGAWEGKSTEEIIAAGGAEDLAGWNKDSIFPFGPGWKPTQGQIIADTSFILSELGEGTSLIVTSNGILRFFARAAANASDFPERKVATGHICVMERIGGDWRILSWNQPPQMLAPMGA